MAQDWCRDDWATNLSALLKGRALDLYPLMPSELCTDYDEVKKAFLLRYDLTEDGFRLRFRSSRPEGAETFAQHSVRSANYLTR